jgi:membrane-associated HD superfamily phosphohydrolase
MIFGIIGIFCLNSSWDLAKLYYYKPYHEEFNYFSDLGYLKKENWKSRLFMRLGSIIICIFFILDCIFNTQSELIKNLILFMGLSLAILGIFSFDRKRRFFTLLHGIGFVNTLIFMIILFLYFNPLISIILIILTIINFIIVVINRIYKLTPEQFRKIECPYQKAFIFIFMLSGLYLFYLIY